MFVWVWPIILWTKKNTFEGGLLLQRTKCEKSIFGKKIWSNFSKRTFCPSDAEFFPDSKMGYSKNILGPKNILTLSKLDFVGQGPVNWNWVPILVFDEKYHALPCYHYIQPWYLFMYRVSQNKISFRIFVNCVYFWLPGAL